MSMSSLISTRHGSLQLRNVSLNNSFEEAITTFNSSSEEMKSQYDRRYDRVMTVKGFIKLFSPSPISLKIEVLCTSLDPLAMYKLVNLPLEASPLSKSADC